MSANSLQIDFGRAADAMMISVAMDPEDVRAFTDFLDSMERKLGRAEILPILLKHLEPLAASERNFLNDHTISGALKTSLSARSGAGDYPGTVSAFSAPTATTKQLQAHWSKGRKQQRRWAANLAGMSGRRAVFYGPIVHQGHRIVKRNKAGELVDTGKRVAPIPFAEQAADSMGEAESDAAANEILDYIFGSGGGEGD